MSANGITGISLSLYDGENLVCVTLYRKGAEEVRCRMVVYELLLTCLLADRWKPVES